VVARRGVPSGDRLQKGADLNPHRDLRALADEIYDTVLAAAPVEASLLGDRRFDAALSDLSRDGLTTLGGRFDRLAARVERIDVAGLSAGDRVTADVAAHVVDHARHELRAGYVEFAAGPMTSGATIGSAASALLTHLPKLTLDTPAHAAAYLQRCRGIPHHLLAAEARMRDGVAAGRAPAARLVAATIRQLDRYLATAPDADPLMPERGAVALETTLRDEVRPALARHRGVLAEQVAPHARPDARVGLCWLPGGEDIYRDAVRLHTTAPLTPDDLHLLGLDLIDELADEYRELGRRVLATSDVDEIFVQLRTAPALRFQSGDEIRGAAEAALARAQSAVGAWFGTLPRIPCEVRDIPAVEAPDSTLAYYQPPPVDGSRPGRYYVNVSDPASRSRFEAEALAFHESVPGHHTQIARALELDLPALQRVFYVTAFVEGWALYAERLADEMGLYSDDVARLGMLSFDSWRACRLVVDTGIHAFGWSRDRAVAFMRANCPQALNNIANEVDRYIGWPGQALAYMAGRSRIVALRQRAEAALGARFHLTAFHDALLEHAAVPLWTLERIVDGWSARQAG
jgi:uncharacterized protein (DUF885 family)